MKVKSDDGGSGVLAKDMEPGKLYWSNGVPCFRPCPHASNQDCIVFLIEPKPVVAHLGSHMATQDGRRYYLSFKSVELVN